MYNSSTTSNGGAKGVGSGTGTGTSRNDDDGAPAAAALIDSYFLPGGILDPEAEEQSSSNHSHTRHPLHHRGGGGGGVNASANLNVTEVDPAHPRAHDNPYALNLAIGSPSLDLEYPQHTKTSARGQRRHNTDIERIGVGGLYPANDEIVGGRPILLAGGGTSSADTPRPLQSTALSSDKSSYSHTQQGQGLLPLSGALLHSFGNHTNSGGAPIAPQAPGPVPTGDHPPTSTTNWFAPSSNKAPSSAGVSSGNEHRSPPLHGNSTPTNNMSQDELSHFFLGALHAQSNVTHQSTPVPAPAPSSSKHDRSNRDKITALGTGRPTSLSSSNESRTNTTATTHIRHNPWSNESLVQLKPNSSNTNNLQYDFASSSNFTNPTTVDSSNNQLPVSRLGGFQHDISNSAKKTVAQGSTPGQPQASMAVRPPPGFSSSSPRAGSLIPSSSSSQQQQQLSVNERRMVGQGLLATIPQHHSSHYQHPHQHDVLGNHESMQQSNNIVQQQQQPTQQSPPQPHMYRKKHSAHYTTNNNIDNNHVHAHDGDYDLSSLNSKSSRDVPSTIYVRSGGTNMDEDAVSNSEDTLTACADSVTVASLPKNSKVGNERMDVVEETSHIEQQQKRTKAKRQKKKRNKKRQNAQESTKSQESQIREKEDVAPIHHEETGLRNRSSRVTEQKDRREPNTNNEKRQSKNNRNGSVSKPQAHSRSSAATTAISSTATTVHKHVVSKKSYPQPKPSVIHDHGRNSARSEERKISKDIKPREPLIETFAKFARKLRPFALDLAARMLALVEHMVQIILILITACFPKKERFWFLLPILCIVLDSLFLFCVTASKIFGKILYFIIICHKLAIFELAESEYASICYTVIFAYPNIVELVKAAIPYQDYWPVFARWIAVDRWFCRPIKMADTYITKMKKQEDRRDAMNHVKHSALAGDGLLRSLKGAVDIVLKRSQEKEIEESERVKMANHILLILRKVTPLILMLEINIRREGFLVLMTSTERILFGYGLTVLRSGYLFSPLIWISWTIQLTIIMFAEPSYYWCHFILVIGLVSVRLSHYTSAVEDLEGSDAANSYTTSRRRKKASHVFI